MTQTSLAVVKSDPKNEAMFLLSRGLLLCSLSRKLEEEEKERLAVKMQGGVSRSMTPSLMVWDAYERKLKTWEDDVSNYLEKQNFDPNKLRSG